MKIRCGSHQQNRSIVRPGLSLMATKVALTAEEFRENSQRSIDLFNTEKLSTDSTHVLKSAYCILCISAVAICTGRVEAKNAAYDLRDRLNGCNLHGACGGKAPIRGRSTSLIWLQSARGVWRQRTRAWRNTPPPARCNLHGACGGKGARFSFYSHYACCNLHGACGGKVLCYSPLIISAFVAICTGRVEAKSPAVGWKSWAHGCNLHGACGGKVYLKDSNGKYCVLQSARGVWRQSA